MTVFVAGAIAELNYPLYAVAVMGTESHKLFYDTPPHAISYSTASKAIDFIVSENAPMFCSNGKKTFLALISIFERSNDFQRAKLASELLTCCADISKHTSLAHIFKNNTHGPQHQPVDYSFVTWNEKNHLVLNALVNETACLVYLESTTTTQGKLARLEGGGVVNADFYKHWTTGYPQRIAYSNV